MKKLVMPCLNFDSEKQFKSSFSTYAKFFKTTNISYPLIRTRAGPCAYQEVRIVSPSKYFAFVSKGWSLNTRVENNFNSLSLYF